MESPGTLLRSDDGFNTPLRWDEVGRTPPPVSRLRFDCFFFPTSDPREGACQRTGTSKTTGAGREATEQTGARRKRISIFLLVLWRLRRSRLGPPRFFPEYRSIEEMQPPYMGGKVLGLRQEHKDEDWRVKFFACRTAMDSISAHDYQTESQW